MLSDVSPIILVRNARLQTFFEVLFRAFIELCVINYHGAVRAYLVSAS